MLKKFPKVPRYDHPVLEGTSLWSAEDLVLLEKMDGQNYRFFLYDDYFEYYVENIDSSLMSEIDKERIENGDIVFGTKKVIRGTTGMDKNEVDSTYHRAYEELSEVDHEKLEEIQKEEGPMILFAEHMTPHSIKAYYKGDNVAPALIGFDIYKPQDDDREEYPGNPYEEKFVGFVDIEKSKSLFQSIGIEFAPVVEENVSNFEDVENLEIPMSEYADVPAEGLVFRSDSLELRAKKTSEYFDEVNKKSWGIHKDEADTGEEYIVAGAVTTPRVRKIYNKFKNKNKDFSGIAMAVLEDIWEEEIEEIRSLNMEINPYNMVDLVLNRTEGELEKIIETSNLISDYENEISDFDVEDLEIDLDPIDVEEENVEEWIVDNYVPVDFIFEVANREFDEVKRDKIDDIYKKVAEEMWYENNKELMRLNSYFKPGEINPIIAKKCARNIN